MEQRETNAISDSVGNAFAVYAVMTTAAELLLRELDLRMYHDHIALKRERRQLINELRKSIERTKYLYQRFTEDCCMNSDGGAFESYDALISDANKVAALVMRFYNATYGDSTNTNDDEIRNFVRGLQVSDLFTEDILAKFEKER